MYKKNIKVMTALLFLTSEIVFAQNIGQSNQNVQNGIVDRMGEYENCQPTPDLPVNEYGQRAYDATYQACLRRNNDRSRARAIANRSAADAQTIANGKPVAPQNNCGTTSGSSGDYDPAYASCINNYNQKMAEYNRQMQVYNDAQTSLEKAKADEAKHAANAKLNDTSVTGSLNEIQDKNENARQMYLLAGVALAGYGAAKFIEAGGFSACCGTANPGCCTKATISAAAGAAFMLLNAKANKQADEHTTSAQDSCKKYNELSSTQKDCNSVGTEPIPTVTTIYTDEGKCKPTAPPGCIDLTTPGTGSGPTIGKIPTNCTSNGKPVSCLATAADNYKKNADGSISVKTPSGLKTFKESDFADVKSMVAAGIPTADANKLFSDLYGKDSPLAKAGADAKNLAATDAKKGLGGGDGLGLGASGSGSLNLDTANSGANKKFGDKLQDVASRRPTSEGLTRDFNGDLIGAAGDDIFTMMNRRYKLKDEQDSFIAP